MARGDVMALYWHTKAAKQGLATAQDRGYGEQEALRTYRDKRIASRVMTSPSIRTVTSMSVPAARRSRRPARSTTARRSCTGHPSTTAMPAL